MKKIKLRTPSKPRNPIANALVSAIYRRRRIVRSKAKEYNRQQQKAITRALKEEKEEKAPWGDFVVGEKVLVGWKDRGGTIAKIVSFTENGANVHKYFKASGRWASKISWHHKSLLKKDGTKFGRSTRKKIDEQTDSPFNLKKTEVKNAYKQTIGFTWMRDNKVIVVIRNKSPYGWAVSWQTLSPYKPTKSWVKAKTVNIRAFKTSRQAEKHVDDMLAGKIQPEVPVVNFPFGGHSEASKNN